MRNTHEVAKPRFRHIIEGNSPAVPRELRRRTRHTYHDRIAQGVIFGARTDEVLPGAGAVPQRIEAYFDAAESRFADIKNQYSLDKLYGTEKFGHIQEEATRLMWAYGIQTDLLGDQQRGLMLLGAAATLLNLNEKFANNKTDPVYRTERKRMLAAVKMLSQHSEGTYSTKVDKLVVNASRKAAADPDLVTRAAAFLQARREAQFTRNQNNQAQPQSTAAEIGQSYFTLAQSHEDTTLSSQLGNNTPHIERLKERIGIDANPEVRWLATNLSPAAFRAIFRGSSAFYTHGTIVVANDITPKINHHFQQHEFIHGITEHTSTPYLGIALGAELDAEINTDLPTFYPHIRLTGYFLEDFMNLRFNLPAGDSSLSKVRLWGAALRAKGRINNQYERAWNEALVSVFGLEGYLAYYLMGVPTAPVDTEVSKHLLDPKQTTKALFDSLMNLSGSNTSHLEMVYSPDQSVLLWNISTGLDIYELLRKSPHVLGEKLSEKQIAALANRIDALKAVPDPDYGITGREISQFSKTLQQIMWLQKGFPLMPDVFYDYRDVTGRQSTEVALERHEQLHTVPRVGIPYDNDVEFIDPDTVELQTGKPFDLNVLKDGRISDYLRYNGSKCLETVPGEDPATQYLSFIHTISRAVSQNMTLESEYANFGSRDILRLIILPSRHMPTPQRAIAEAILHGHARIHNEEQGNLTNTRERMLTEVLEPMSHPEEELVMKSDNAGQVYNAVTQTSAFSLFTVIEATRQFLGCPPAALDNDIPFVTIPKIHRKEDAAHVFIVNEDEYLTKRYDLQNARRESLRTNLLLAIYGYLENQIQVYDERVASIQHSRRATQHLYEIHPLETSLTYSSVHFGVSDIYKHPSFETNTMIYGDQDAGSDMMLRHLQLSSQKPFDLSAIDGMRDELDALTIQLETAFGPVKAERVKQVLEAGVKLTD